MNRHGSAEPAAIIKLDSVRKVYGTDDNRVEALAGVTFEADRGTFTAMMGPSGSGKSTFLHCAAGLDLPTSGSVVLEGHELTSLGETELTKLRRDRIGFVFEAFNLLSALTVLQNVTLPLDLAGRQVDRAECLEVLEWVGLGHRVDHRPSELSGGQQQRVAIARALVTQPAVIFADEPTGALDSRTSKDILELLHRSTRTGEQTILMVTHDPVAASYADHVVFLADGQIVAELADPTTDAVAEQMAQLSARVASRAAGSA